MTGHDIESIIAFLGRAERLKQTLRSAHTSNGRQESTAEHTWRLCLMALVLRDRFPEVDFEKLLRILLVHDLGEALHGDIPAPRQGTEPKAAAERADLTEIVSPLPPAQRQEILALWEEYEAGVTPEARLAKGLDKLETILQHIQGKNPEGFDYRFNLHYGQAWTTDDPRLAEIRRLLDEATERRAREAEGRR